jgi:hypothetical protein
MENALPEVSRALSSMAALERCFAWLARTFVLSPELSSVAIQSSGLAGRPGLKLLRCNRSAAKDCPIPDNQYQRHLAMHDRVFVVTVIAISTLGAFTAKGASLSGGVCVVANPARPYAELYVSPNGKMFGKIENGIKVELEDWSVDSTKKTWAKVKNGKWVFFNDIDCTPGELNK